MTESSEMPDPKLELDLWVDEPGSPYGCRPYACAFSQDGEILAYGGGGWYGDGFLSCRWPGGEVTTVNLAEAAGQNMAVTALLFTASSEHLFVATRGPSFHSGPLLVFRLKGRQLELARQMESGLGRGNFLRGLCFAKDKLVAFATPMKAFEVPEESCFGPNYCATGMVVHEHSVWAARGEQFEELRLTPGEDDSGWMYTSPIPNHYLAKNHQNGEFASVAPCGDVITWWRVGDGGLQVQHALQILPPTRPLAPRDRNEPRVVQATCFLGHTGVLAVASRCGRISLFREGKELGGWWLPDGSPRALASSPDGQRLVVGCKASVHPPKAIKQMREMNPPLDPKTQDIREGRLFEYGLERCLPKVRVSSN